MAHGIAQLETRDWEFKNNVRILGGLMGGGSKYQLSEYFDKLPSVNASAAYSVNTNFEILGTNASADDVTFASTIAGIQLQTDGADNDQVIVLPHLVSGLTAWTGIKWGTENQTEWECCIRTSASIATQLIWAGLKLTNTPTIATDNDQVFFRYSTDDSNTNWQIISSIGGTDTTTNSGIAVAASTNYRFRVKIINSRSAECYINDVLIYRTTALTNDVDLIPYVGIQALDTAVVTMNLSYEKISRIIFE